MARGGVAAPGACGMRGLGGRPAGCPLLGPAPCAGGRVERRLLYELQRACLAVERTNYTVDVLEWIRTLGGRPLKRPLPKTRWVDARLRLTAALHYADRLPGGHQDDPLCRLLADAVH